MKKKFGFIGVGNMASAIISGMLNNDFVAPSDINIFDLDKSKCQTFESIGVTALDSTHSVVEKSDIIVLAIKPQNYADVLNDLSTLDLDAKIFVSIAAGISIDYIRTMLCSDVKVVRVMPNTPLLLSKGATALCPSSDMSECEYSPVVRIFSLSGVVEIIDESHMNEIIALNGSSPAFVYLFAKAMRDYANDCGIDKQQALNLICATFDGSAQMMRDSGDDLDTLIEKVSSPGGTTIAALNSFRENNFESIIKEAMKACTDRAVALGK